MFDDDQDKSMARNQLIAILVMTVLLVVWLNYFMPKPAPQPQQPPQQTQTQQQQPQPGHPSTSSPTPGTPTAATPPDAPQFLPPVADQSNPEADDIVLEDDSMRVVFTPIGGRLKRAYVKLHMHGETEIQLVPTPPVPEDPTVPLPTDIEIDYPLGVRFTDDRIGDHLDRVRFDLVDRDERSVTFGVTLDGMARFEKTYSLDDRPYVLRTRVDYENLADTASVIGEDRTPGYYLTWSPNVASGDLSKGIRQAVVWRKDGELETLRTDKMKPKDGAAFSKSEMDVEWAGIRSAYFLVAMKHDGGLRPVRASGDKTRFHLETGVSRFEVAPGAVQSDSWDVYIGPSYAPALAAAWDSLATSKRFFESVNTMDAFSKLLLRLLNAFYSVIPSYGWAIIFLTILVRSMMFPLTIKQMRSMKKMQLLAPEIEELKAKYGEDAQELNKRMMELYRERGVNPIGGCLPMLLQLPVFIGLYRMLWGAFELRGAPFTLLKFGDYHWVSDLAQPDRLLHLAGFVPAISDLPFVGQHLAYLNILPLLGAAAMVLSTKLMPTTGPAQNPQQKMMMTFMPIFFGVICYRFASGLNLYILTSTVLGILQNKLVKPGKVDVTEKRPPRKKQHFYTAAKARKRRLKESGKGSTPQSSGGSRKKGPGTKRRG
ncbi:MAG: membrane protein insertase YidC [bacterium]|nr:membrane protein insertase YidC [bacterium]